MADELVGGVIEPHRYARVEADLSHQDEEGEDRVPVVRHHVVEVSSQQVHRCRNAVKVCKTHKSDRGHSEAQFDAGRKKGQKHDERDDADSHLIHIDPSRS